MYAKALKKRGKRKRSRAPSAAYTRRKRVYHFLSSKGTTHCPEGHKYTLDNCRLQEGRIICQQCEEASLPPDSPPVVPIPQ